MGMLYGNGLESVALSCYVSIMFASCLVVR